MSPTVFLSYSLNKSYDPSLVKTLLAEISSCAAAHQWCIHDPLENVSGDSDGIREKVSSHLYKSDALFAECTTGVPNVMFEIGFARALRLPIVFFVNREVFVADAEQLQKHLQFVGLHPDRPLASDLGDLEYFEYTSEIRTGPGAESFRRRLGALMQRMQANALSEGMRRLRQACMLLMQETADLAKAYKKDHPFLRFVGGWLNHLHQEFIREGRLVFQVDHSAYQNCLSAFQNWTHGDVRAIADLTDNTESFWRRRPDPLKTSVSERIFVVDWNIFFDSSKFRQLCIFLREQSKHYSVRVVHSDGCVSGDQHQFGADGIGQHLLLMEPDVVGGYIKRNDKRCLRIESNAGLYELAAFQYELATERSFAIKPDWTDPEIRRAWMQTGKIGFWNNHWQEVESRSEDYFRNYDMHIRFWIPFYDQLISQTSAIIQGEIARLMRSDDDFLNLLEIGFGTGALTFPLLQWIQNLNAPFTLLKKEPPVRHYYGIDRASQMCDVISEKLKRSVNGNVNHSFLNGVAMDGLPLIIRPKSCAVIFGTLVLHDIMGESPTSAFPAMLEATKNALRPGGSLIFADPFFAMEEQQRGRQIEYWRRNMMMNGLTKEEVDQFLESNQDMVNSVRIDEIRQLSCKAGFDFADPGPLPGPSHLSPFRVIILRSTM